jgi:hypothetical protein
VKSYRLHNVVCLLLLLSLVCFSGLAQASLLLLDAPAAHDNCCPPDDRPPADEPAAPCSSLECQCLECSGALFHSHIPIPRTTAADSAAICCDHGSLLPGFIPPIDYPPESA